MPERLIRVRVDHPIARCLELADALGARFALRLVEVTPTDADAAGGAVGLAEAGAEEIARWLRRPQPLVMAVGTGRTLKAAVDQLDRIACPQHRIVSLTGNIGPDGSAAYYNVIYSMAEAIEARHFPMPLPVFVSSPEERALMHGQALIGSTLRLAAEADVAFVGIGENGHLAFNDPPADFETEAPYIVVNLDEACRRQQVGEGWFAGLEDVPTQAISMSVRQIMKSQEIICIVPDARKAEAVRNCFENPISPLYPASILKAHRNTTVYLDTESSSLLKTPHTGN